MDLDSLWGYIRPSGEFQIEPSFRSLWDSKGSMLLAGASPFQEGLARIVVKGKAGYIDKSGSVAFTIDFPMALPFKEGAGDCSSR